MKLAQPFLFALVVSAILVLICRAIVLRLGYVAEDRSPAPQDRRGRTPPKALFGGVAIALTLFGGAIARGTFGPVT